MLGNYFAEFLWKKAYGKELNFNIWLRHVALVYNPNRPRNIVIFDRAPNPEDEEFEEHLADDLDQENHEPEAPLYDNNGERIDFNAMSDGDDDDNSEDNNSEDDEWKCQVYNVTRAYCSLLINLYMHFTNKLNKEAMLVLIQTNTTFCIISRKFELIRLFFGTLTVNNSWTAEPK